MDQSSPVLNHKKVLIVEDEVFIGDLFEYLLSKAEIQVIRSMDGADGLEKANDKPDLILLDIMLPKMNGIDVLTKLKLNPETKNIPVVLVTNLGQANIVKKAFELGAQGYLLKINLDYPNLIPTIKKYLDDPKYTMSYERLDLE